MTRFLPLLVPAFALLAACSGKDPTTDDSDSSGNLDSDTQHLDDTGSCATAVLETEPVDGTGDVYYHDTITVTFDGDGGAAVFTLLDAAGTPVPVSATWTDGNVQAVLTAELAPLTTYTLTTEICGTPSSMSFTTSELGTALTVDPASLVGSTYMFRLSDASITEPAFLDIVANAYLTVPILIGVDQSDAETIDLLGGLGYEDGSTYAQEPGLPTWDFPVADFTAQPFFAAASPLVTIMYGTTPIPINNFTLEGTFSADGSMIAHGLATGTGDTRYMAPLVGKPADDYGAMCDFAAAAGVYCIACPDGEPYCLYIVAENINATKVDGLTMETIP